MVNWSEGTRGQLLARLRRSKRTINELAIDLGISDNAVRVHLTALQRDGLVQSAGLERSTGGKPPRLYETTQKAEELFPKAYGLVLTELIRLLQEERGSDGLKTLLRELGARAGGGRSRNAPDIADRVEHAAEVLRELGGDVDVELDGSDWMIRGYACPLSAVTSEHSEVCCMAESLVGEITGGKVTELCTRGDRPRCAFRISAEPS